MIEIICYIRIVLVSFLTIGLIIAIALFLDNNKNKKIASFFKVLIIIGISLVIINIIIKSEIRKEIINAVSGNELLQLDSSDFNNYSNIDDIRLELAKLKRAKKSYKTCDRNMRYKIDFIDNNSQKKNSIILYQNSKYPEIFHVKSNYYLFEQEVGILESHIVKEF